MKGRGSLVLSPLQADERVLIGFCGKQIIDNGIVYQKDGSGRFINKYYMNSVN